MKIYIKFTIAIWPILFIYVLNHARILLQLLIIIVVLYNMDEFLSLQWGNLLLYSVKYPTTRNINK